MSNKKATKRALLTSITALAMCVVMLVGTTFAWFTDTATANVNKIQAGNLDVALEMLDGTSWVTAEGQTLNFVKAAGGESQAILWEPGAEYKLPKLRVRNDGNLALKYEVAITGAVDATPNNGVNDLELLDVITFSASIGGGTATSGVYGTTIADGALNAKDDAQTIQLSAKMDENAGNKYQEMAISGIAITVKAMQASSEYDSNGTTYDDAADMTPDNLDKRISANVTVPVASSGDTKISNADQTAVATVPETAVKDSSGELTLKVAADDSAAANVSISSAQAALGYEVEVVGLDTTNTAPVKVELKVGAGLTNVVLYHNGNPMTKGTSADSLTDGQYFYNESTGILTFATSTFSPFAVVYDAPTAVIGDTYYDTLADAVAAAKDGDTITLLKDSTENGVKGENKGFVLDLNGHTLKIGNPLVGSTGTETNGFQLLKSAGNVTFKNGTLTTEEAYILIQNYCNLTLDNMVLDGRNIPVHATRPDSVVRYTLSNNCGNVTINNSTIYAPETLGVAFDSCKYDDYAIPTVTVSGNSTIYGRIEETGGNIVIKGGSFTDLANAVKYAADGATIKLAADAAGSGLASADGAKVRDNLTVDFAGHTYTMVNPAVGSKGTETQAMHWGTSLSNITMKNGTFKVADNATEVAMAMQNYINFTAEGMTFDFAGISVAHYAENEFTGKYEKYNGKECPMFNNNGGKVVLTKCVVTLPEASEFGSIISGTMELNDSAFNGYVGFNDIDGTVIVNGTSSIKGGEVKDYFGDLAIVNNNGTWTATKNA